ncbi:MAG: SCO family protein [Planctomycetales bacterium]
MEPRDTAASPQLRLWLWIAGSVLWIAVVITAIFFLYVRDTIERGRNARASDARARADLKAVENELASRPTGPVIVEKQPVGAWDPNGIEDFEFAECRGGTVTKQDLLGKPWLASFIFTRCASTCPLIMRSMWELERNLGDVDLRFVSLTVDPAFDTVEVLGKEAEEFEAEEGRWLFLTGEQADIYHLIWNSFKMPVKEITGPDRQPGFQVMHSNNIMLVDSTGVVVGKYDGTNQADMAKLRRRVRELVEQEAESPGGSREGSSDGTP